MAVKRWLAHRLAMGHTGNVNQLIGAFGKDMANREKLSEPQKMLNCAPPKHDLKYKYEPNHQ